MRVRKTNGGLKVHAVAGTYVVLLGFDLAEADCKGLLGFSIHRTGQTENKAYYLSGMKACSETDPGFPPGSLYSAVSGICNLLYLYPESRTPSSLEA